MNLNDDLLEVFLILYGMRDELAVRADYQAMACVNRAMKELAEVRILIHEKE